MATISGTILKPDGTPREAVLFFYPLSTPSINDESAIVTTQPVQVESDEDDGAFSIDLTAGNYRVTVGGDCFEITVGDEDADISDITTSGLTNMAPASNEHQGTFYGTGADFELPQNDVGETGSPVATGFTRSVYGPGKFQIEVLLGIQATSRDDDVNDNEVYSAYIKDTTNSVVVGSQVEIQDIYTGTKGQMLLRGTVEIADDSQVLLEVYAAGNPNPDNETEAPNSVGTVLITKSSFSITRLP